MSPALKVRSLGSYSELGDLKMIPTSQNLPVHFRCNSREPDGWMCQGEEGLVDNLHWADHFDDLLDYDLGQGV